MANQLGMDKSLAIKSLRNEGMSERAIARALDVSRNAVRSHLRGLPSKGTKAPTGSIGDLTAGISTGSRSLCEPFRETILSKLAKAEDGPRSGSGKRSLPQNAN